jgi:hypothetical protein
MSAAVAHRVVKAREFLLGLAASVMMHPGGFIDDQSMTPSALRGKPNLSLWLRS